MLLHAQSFRRVTFFRDDLQQLMSWLVTQKTAKLWLLMPWMQALRTWVQPNMQHDVAEFAKHLLANELLMAPLRGEWQTRMQVGSAVQVTDRGTTWPILLPEPLLTQQECMLQSLIDAWESQAAPHALAAGPSELLLQLNRFREVGAVYTKSSTPVVPTDTLSIPVFHADGLRRGTLRYQLRAAIIHIGDTPQSGHYRAVTFNAGASAYMHDDNKIAQKLTAKLLKTLHTQVYLCLYSRTEDPHAGPAVNMLPDTPPTSSAG